jgi:hypothetical protein
MLLVLLAALLAATRADTPANCTYMSIVGQWVFNLGPGGNNNSFVDILFLLRLSSSSCAGSTALFPLNL